MRKVIQNILFHPLAIILIIVFSAILSYFTGGLGTIFGIVVAFLALWSSGFDWELFSLSKPNWFNNFSQSFVYAVLLFIVFDIIIQPFIEVAFGKIDLEGLDFIRGNFQNYILFCILMWVMAAFGEEFLYRGFFMKQIAILFGNSQNVWIFSAAIIGVIFGLAHAYQGISGVLTTGIIGFFFGLIFSKNRKNLWLLIFIHGLYDMIGITLIYLDCERIIVDEIIKVLI